MSNEKCDRCGIIGSDRRTLWMACFYAMDELGVPFKEQALYDGIAHETLGPRHFFTLRVCKGCRGDWLQAIRTWFRAPPSDNARYNNDEGTDPKDDLPALLAQAEKLRTDLHALSQRAEVYTTALRDALAERED